jgi:hypothetical protein
MDNLIKYANKVPEIGHGGKSIGDYLVKAASKVKSGHVIIDIAPCFGSTTLFLAAGIRKSGNDVMIYSYDRWIADDKMDIKINRKLNKKYPEGYDFKNIFMDFISPVSDLVVPVQCHVNDISWDGGPKIGLYIDDIGVGKKRVDHLMKTFSPYFVPGKTELYMLDYYQHTTRPHMRHMRYQKDFFDANSKVFQFIERCTGSVTARLLYLGGKINYDVKGFSCGQDTAQSEA